MKWKAYPEYKEFASPLCPEIPRQWEARRLKTVVRFGYGDSLATGDRMPGEVDVFGSNGIVGQHDRPNADGPCLIIGRKGSFGKVAYSEKPCYAIDTTYFVDPTQTQQDIRWLYYCLQWLRLDSISKDSAVPGLAREDAYEHLVPFCSADEQCAIASFLDRETLRIDLLIEKKRRQIELLQEKRTALISHAVTKGLNPDVKMKDSGFEWLGEIPEHWALKPLKRTFRILNGSTPKSSEPTYWDGDIPWVTPDDLGSMKGDTLETTQRMITQEGYESCGTSLAPAGSLILSTRAPIGHLALAGVPMCTNQGCRSLAFRGEDNIRFYYYKLLAAKQELESWGQGCTFKELSRDRLGHVFLSSPPIDEQRAIAAFLDRETARIDAMIGKVRDSIEKLREYRTALISAAVTGKIDVRETTA